MDVQLKAQILVSPTGTSAKYQILCSQRKLSAKGGGSLSWAAHCCVVFFFFSCVKCQIRGIATRPCAGSLFYCYLYLHLYLNHGFYDISFSSPPFFFLIFFCYMGLIGSQVKWWWLIQKPRRAWYEMVSINSFFC